MANRKESVKWMLCFAVVVALAYLADYTGLFPLQAGMHDTLSRDAVFTGSATILGLVAFGALLNIIFLRKHTPLFGLGDVRMLLYGMVISSLATCMLLFVACCGVMSTFQFLIFLIMLFMGMLAVIVGATKLITIWIKSDGYGTSRSHQ